VPCILPKKASYCSALRHRFNEARVNFHGFPLLAH
jgi:hypothetical protein